MFHYILDEAGEHLIQFCELTKRLTKLYVIDNTQFCHKERERERL